MKTINETFEDKEHQDLKKFKKNLSWHDFIMVMYTHCIDAEKRGDFRIE